MTFLNLSLGEFLALAGFVSAGLLALYLLDRSKRRQVVATLRFWVAGQVPEESKHKRRIQQPWSLFLQILSLLLLLLAIAGPRLGDMGNSRDHVLLLDTSAWMGARARQGILLDQAKSMALSYVNSLPPSDRVMLVRADALATPVTPFELDRKAVADAVRQSRPSTSALNLEQALEFAQQAQKLQSRKTGEIVFAGAARVSSRDAELTPPPNLRLLAIPAAGENVGIRKLAVRRVGQTGAAPGSASANSWEAYVGLRNEGLKAREVELLVSYAGTQAGNKVMTLEPGTESQTTFVFHAQASGLVEARIRTTNGRGDAFPQDDRAVIELPIGKMLKVAVYSADAALMKPLLAGLAQVNATYQTPAQYDPQAPADIVVFDRFAPREAPRGASIWIEPPAGSPFTIRSVAAKVKLNRWHQDTPLGAGLNTQDAEVASTQVFSPVQGDQPVAEISQGPVVVMRPGTVKMAALGFHPLRSTLKYDLAAPLLIANTLRWMAPDIFRRSDVQAGTVGTISAALESGVNAANIKVFGENQRPLPFAIEGKNLRFFAGAPGNIHVMMGDHETVYSITLPDTGDVAWQPPPGVARGIGRTTVPSGSVPNPWPWLALLGGLGLLADWLLFGRNRMVRLSPRGVIATLAEHLPWDRNARKAS
ncbi:MAG: VWA domain-containing protein [Bryobacterales bacterium]|nr:VWA domain-containing protein [Bryobacterales bacterium]